MLFKRVFKISIFISLLCCAFVFFTNKVSAVYRFCDDKIENTNYYDCGNYIYTYYEDTLHSSMIYSSDEDASILYAGEKDGVSIFYSNGFKYYNFSYDDRSNKDNNLWSIISHRGKVIYDGSFNDSWLIDDSHHGLYYYTLYADVYTIRQYANDGKLYRTIAIYNIGEGSIDFIKTLYDGVEFSADIINEVYEAKQGISIETNSMYGIKSVSANIDGNYIDATIIGKKVLIDKDSLNPHLSKSSVVELEVELQDYLLIKSKKVFSIKMVSDNVQIKFSTMSVDSKMPSRRIVIEATSGKNKALDTDYCWYYWSKSPDDSLQYDDFLVNYAKSSYKGSYSEDKGVILRNTSGTYYLYALAKDDDSWIVERSEGYVLNNKSNKVEYTIGDAILIVSLLIICVAPISIYLFIRKKGY